VLLLLSRGSEGPPASGSASSHGTHRLDDQHSITRKGPEGQNTFRAFFFWRASRVLVVLRLPMSHLDFSRHAQAEAWAYVRGDAWAYVRGDAWAYVPDDAWAYIPGNACAQAYRLPQRYGGLPKPYAQEEARPHVRGHVR
jgi:hypothetical protein